MAHYTMELGELMKATNFNIGLQDYPIYKNNQDLRKQINDAIIEEFYFHEIGQEVPERFKRRLNHRMNKIMPYYNQLFKSEDVEFNPLYNIELEETFKQTGKSTSKSTGKTTGESNSEGTSNSESIGVEDDSPASAFTMEEVKTNKYASKIGRDVSEGETTGKVTDSTTNDIDNLENNEGEYTKITKGSSAGLSFSNAIKQWRGIMINIIPLILDDLRDLFIGIY